MSVFVISCALHDTTHDYAPLWADLEKAGAQRAMETVWLFETTSTVGEVTRKTLSHLQRGDRLLVVELSSGWSATNLLDDTGSWLKSRRP